MGSIQPFLPPDVYDDATTRNMGEAFNAACKALYATVQPEKVVQNAIARRIMIAASKGVRDVTLLRHAALRGLAGPSHAASK